MSAIKGLEWTFDTVASAYEKFRPTYSDELYKMIFDYIACHAVEVGIADRVYRGAGVAEDGNGRKIRFHGYNIST